MTFDNGKTIIWLRLRVFIATIIMLIYLYLVYFGKHLNFPLFGIEEIALTMLVTAIYFLIAFLPMMLKYKYIYFSDDGDKIIFRYYSVGLIRGKMSSLEIPKNIFQGYDIKQPFPGLIIKIYLYQLMGKKKAAYPPVYIGSLSKKELNKIITSLNKYN